LPTEVIVDIYGPDGDTLAGTLTLNSGNSWTDELCELLPGEYYAVEREVPGWHTVGNDGPVDVIANDTVTITIDNEIDRGCLEVTKAFTNYPEGYMLPAVIVDIYGPDSDTLAGTLTLNTDNSWTDELCDLLPGVYYAVERTVEGWTTTGNTGPVSVIANDTAHITITNALELCEETIWAKLVGTDPAAIPFEGTGNWGWYAGPLPEGDYEFELWAGAAFNDTSKGTFVGMLYMTYDGGCVSFTLDMEDGFAKPTFSHVYISETAGIPSFPQDFTKDTLAEDELCGFTDSIYFAYHSVVMMPCGD
jgi:hypothetical protein